MEKYINNLLYLIPIMFYYLIEALIVGMFISLIWRFLLSGLFGYLTYLQIVGMYWIIKMLFFDVFKLISGLFTMNADYQDNDNDESNNQIYHTA